MNAHGAGAAARAGQAPAAPYHESVAGTLVRFEVAEGEIIRVGQVLDAVKRHRPTIFPGVPTKYVAINNVPGVRRYDIRSIRACVSGAAPLPVLKRSDVVFMYGAGRETYQQYGATVLASKPSFSRR